jgi:hypothetical protein
VKQGTGRSSDSGRKVEPKAHGVSPKCVSELGAHQVRTKSVTMYTDRGIEAPMVGKQSHPRGSQGRH